MSTPLHVDVDLIRKYDVAGPRYTSYPTAAEFTPDFSREALLEGIANDNREPRPLSLYFHIPFCETLCWFCGCTTVITRDHEHADEYIDALERELELTVPHLNPANRVVQVHFGGGTPNFLSPEQITRMSRLIRAHFQLASDAEISVELDPRRLTLEHVQAFRALGATRASFGIQDLNTMVQQAVHRIQPKALSDQAASFVREAGYQSLNVDLIYGLPLQTVDSFADTVAQALELRPDRFAVFSYAHVPWMKPAQKLLPLASLPTPEAKLRMLKGVIETLTARGYTYIGMDHFALDGDELAVAQRAHTLQRNFQGYSTRAGADIYAFGMSSISQTSSHYRQNEKTLKAYQARLENAELPAHRMRWLTSEDRIRREVIMRLMCDLELDFDALSSRLAIDFRRHFAAEISALGRLEADGLLELDRCGVRVTDNGRLLIRNLAMTFDAYLSQSQSRFSRTV